MMHTETLPIMRTYPTIVQSIGLSGILIALMLVVSPLTLVLNPILGKDLSMLSYYLITTGGAFWIINRIRKNVTGETSFVLAIDARIVPVIVIATVALIFGIISPVSTLIPMPEVFKDMFRSMLDDTGVAGFVMLVIAAPIFEELIFRGIMLEGLLRKYSPQTSIFLSSFLFGLVHLNPWQFITGFILGIFLGWVYYNTRSVLPSIIIHAAANFCSFVAWMFVDKETVFDETIFTMYGGAGNLALVILICAITTAMCIYFLTNQFRKTAPVIQAAGHDHATPDTNNITHRSNEPGVDS